MGLAAPASALLGITLPPIPPLTTAPVPITTSTTPTDLTPNSLLDLSQLNPSVDGLLGLTDLSGGLTQASTSLTQLLAGLAGGAAVAAPVVQATATQAAGTAITNLVTRVNNTIAAAAALNGQDASDQLLASVGDIQAQATGEVASLLPLALTTGLQVAQNIVTPVCGLTAVPTSLIPGVGVDTTRLWTAAAPVIQQTDQNTNQLLRDSYSNLYDQALASVNNIPNVGPIASALLLLLKYNWTSSYTPPGSTTPIVTTTKALMNVPTPIDVDHDGIFDLCGTTSFALTGSGTSISGIKFTQTLTKMPLAKPVLPVEISGGLLNVLNFGYDTTESTVPTIYTTAATLDTATGGKLNIDNTYAVHRGTNLTIPPLSLAALNLTTAQLPTFPTLLTPAPKPIVTQEVCIGACTGIAIKDRFENVPSTTHVDGPLASAGVNTNYSAPSTSDSYSHVFGLSSSISLGTSAGRDQAVGEVPNPSSTLAPTSFTSCLSITDGSCASTPVGTDKVSARFKSSTPTLAEDNVAIGGTPSNTCTGVASLGATVHVTGTQFETSSSPGTTAVPSGRVAIDTGGNAADGCVAFGSVLGLTGAPNMTLPVGFSANKRVSTYHLIANPILSFLLQGVGIDSKVGSITCPTGVASGFTSLSPAGSVDLAPVFCFLPPVNTVAPSISGPALVDSTLTVNTGTWTPGDPNAPTLTKQWQKCDAAGTVGSCVDIPGATGSTYMLQYGAETPTPTEPTDWHHTFRVVVTGKNLDNPAGISVPSPLTGLVQLPPKPVNTVAPTLGSQRQVGTALTITSPGTWSPGASSYLYQWQQCDAMGTPASCADIAGATGATFTIRSADKGLTLRVKVTGKNHGGLSDLPGISLTAFIPPNPVNNTPPGIKNGPADAIGATVLTGDNLTASAGAWDFTTGPFTYQWQRCDVSAVCTDITGATSQGYNVQHPGDDGNTLRVAVTGHGLNGDTTVTSGMTGVVLYNDLSAKLVTQIPDGTVNATVAGAGTTSYVGGSFDTVGAPTGGSGRVSDTGTGTTVSAPSSTAGAANGGVTATAPDGAGGYFLGGTFTQVKGVQCPTLAHLFSDGSVDPAYCYTGLSGTVNALTRVAGGVSKVLAVGGDFTFNGHKNLMFIDPAAPAAPVFDAAGDPNGPVNSLTANNNTNNVVYLGGKFSLAGGTSAGNLAAETLTWTTGKLTAAARNNWSQSVCIGTPVGTTACSTGTAASVNTVNWAQVQTVLGPVYLVAVGGKFDTTYRGGGAAPTSVSARGNALIVYDSGATPTLLGWDPKITGGAAMVNAIVIGAVNGVNSTPVYIGGDFTAMNGVAMKNLGEYGVTALGASAGSGANNNSGPMTTWSPSPDKAVTSLAYAGTNSTATLIVGGAFTSIKSGPIANQTPLARHRLAKINLGPTTGSVIPIVDATWDPNAGRTVRTVSRDATLGQVLVGGDFIVLGGKTRNNLAEFDPNSGVTAWSPSADGTVKALAFRNGTIYAGGTFANVGGSARADLAAIDASTGAVGTWNPGANGPVNTIATDASNVYVGGAFGTAGGATRANLAAIDSSGTATGWNPGTDGSVKALAVSGGTVYVGGSFANAGGAARNNAAAIDASGASTGFDPNADGAVNALSASAAGVYLGGSFAHLGPDARASIGFVDANTGAAAAWNPGTDGAVNALFALGAQVFIGGLFNNAGGAPRTNLALLDPGSDNARGFAPNPNGAVNSLSRTSGGSLTVGGVFAIIAGQAAPSLGFFGG